MKYGVLELVEGSFQLGEEVKRVESFKYIDQ
jgi:hypothetical protein